MPSLRVSQSGPLQENLGTKGGIRNPETRVDLREGCQVNEEETEETKRLDKGTNQQVKQMDQALLLIPAIMAAYRRVVHTWNRWYVAILMVLATGIQA